MILVFAICTVVVLYVATSATAQTGSDFAVVGLVHGIVLFALIATLGGVSGGHFNPAVTFAAAWLGRVGPLTGSAVNPARWFGPALIGNHFGGTWPYLVGPLVGALAAALLYRFVIAGPQFALGPEPPTGGAEVVENVAADVSTATRPRD